MRIIDDDLLTTYFHYEGDILYLSIMGKPMIILNSAKSAIDLLDKRGAVYSDRPVFPMVGDLYVLSST